MFDHERYNQEEIEVKMPEKNVGKCSNCGGNPLAVDLRHGTVVCLHCGLIVRSDLKVKGELRSLFGWGRW